MGYPVTLGPEGKLHVLLQPDVLLSIQYLVIYQRTARLNPDKESMLAVLQDAVDCFQKNIRAQDSKEKTRFREVEEWIMAGEREEFFFFESICEILDINPSHLRRGLLQWKKRMLGKRKKITPAIALRPV